MKWKTTERYFRQMLAQQLGIPIVGEIFFAVPSGSSTSRYEEYLRREMDIPAELLFTGSLAPLNAYNATLAYRNDVVIVFPGAYALTAELAWSKAQTHMVGAGGPNTYGDYSEPNVAVYSSTITVASVVTVTGVNCQFINVAFVNAGANAACLTGLTANAYGCRYKNCSMQGNMQSAQVAVVAAASLYVGGAAMFNLFEDCMIGNDCWAKRTGANSGQLRFTGTVQPNGIQFIRGRIVSWSSTATCAAVALPANGAVGRGLVFDNVIFQNLNDPSFADLNNVFYDNDAAGQTILLKDCVNMGYAEWQAGGAGVDRRIFSNMGVATAGGGIVIEPTATIS